MVNKVMLIGNLGRDPELRHTQSGTAVCNFSIATSRRWRDKQGEKREETEWHRCVAWARLAEVCGEYLAKGSRVFVDGRLETRKWEDRDGNERYTTEIVVENMTMLGGGQSNGQRDAGGYDPSSDPGPGGQGVTDDDIPF